MYCCYFGLILVFFYCFSIIISFLIQSNQHAITHWLTGSSLHERLPTNRLVPLSFSVFSTSHQSPSRSSTSKRSPSPHINHATRTHNSYSQSLRTFPFRPICRSLAHTHQGTVKAGPGFWWADVMSETTVGEPCAEHTHSLTHSLTHSVLSFRRWCLWVEAKAFVVQYSNALLPKYHQPLQYAINICTSLCHLFR